MFRIGVQCARRMGAQEEVKPLWNGRHYSLEILKNNYHLIQSQIKREVMKRPLDIHVGSRITYNRPKMEDVNYPSTNERIDKMKTIWAKEYYFTLKGKEMLQHGRIFEITLFSETI